MSPPSPPSSTTPPTLADVLANNSPAPWTLAAFMAYLSQNHCLETLEFTMDAQRYKTSYEQVTEARGSRSARDNDYLCSLWEKLVQAYLVPCAPREINIPSYVRERLLHLSPSSLPPRPEELREAVETVEELMRDSVFLPFLESVSAPTPESVSSEAMSTSLSRSTGRSMLRMAKHKSSNSSSSSSSTVSQALSFSPKFLHHHHHNHHNHHLLHLRSPSDSLSDSSASPEIPEHELFSDDGTSFGSPATLDPVSPPMTPPTPESPSGSFQRVMAAHTNAWKKVKLGFKKKPKTPSSTIMSFPSGEDLTMTDVSNSPIDGLSMPFDGAPFDGSHVLSHAPHPAAPIPPLSQFPYDR
jgi:hypothetical protein